MIPAASAIVGFSSISFFLASAPLRKGNEVSPSFYAKRSFTSAASCHPCFTWSGQRGRMPEFTLFNSNSEQQPEGTRGAEMSDDALLPPDDADYLLKLVSRCVGSGTAVNIGGILFPDISRPNLLHSLLMISLPVLVAAIILLKECYSVTNEDLF